jgi:hypothetical protein
LVDEGGGFSPVLPEREWSVGNWEHAHLFMDDGGVVVAESDLSSQEVVLTGGGGGSQTLAQTLVLGNDPDGTAIQGADGGSGAAGGVVTIRAGAGDDGNDEASVLILQGGNGSGLAGKAVLITNDSVGTSGTALVSDGDGKLVYGGIQILSGVPSGAPNGTFPFAYDTTAITGGLYIWDVGSGWIKVATIL